MGLIYVDCPKCKHKVGLEPIKMKNGTKIHCNNCDSDITINLKSDSGKVQSESVEEMIKKTLPKEIKIKLGKR